jgi:hypothetical protein
MVLSTIIFAARRMLPGQDHIYLAASYLRGGGYPHHVMWLLVFEKMSPFFS